MDQSVTDNGRHFEFAQPDEYLLYGRLVTPEKETGSWVYCANYRSKPTAAQVNAEAERVSKIWRDQLTEHRWLHDTEFRVVKVTKTLTVLEIPDLQ